MYVKKNFEENMLQNSDIHMQYPVGNKMLSVNFVVLQLIATILVIFAHSVTTITSNLEHYVYPKYSCKYTCMHQHVPKHFVIFVMALHSCGCL